MAIGFLYFLDIYESRFLFVPDAFAVGFFILLFCCPVVFCLLGEVITCLLDQVFVLFARNNVSIDAHFRPQIIHDPCQQLALCHRFALLRMNAGDH